MCAAFADSDPEGTYDSQLTLGTGSLLSIFFGLVMVCGIFFGLGFSLGRRGATQMASQKPPVVAEPVSVPAAQAPIAPAQPLFATSTPTLTVQVPETPQAAPKLLPAVPIPHARKETTPELSVAALSATGLKPAVKADPITTALATPAASRTFIPKPSAIREVPAETSSTLPIAYRTASNQWKWTAPFDVNPSAAKLKPALRNARLNTMSGIAHPPQVRTAGVETTSLVAIRSTNADSRAAAVIQIAALSRQDDAQVLTDALRKHGFVASIHNDNDDTLYHVQVGPLERHAALVTQQRLLARGYNAVVK